MKLKNLISIICLAVFLATNAVRSVGTAKSTKNNYEEPADPNWLKNHHRVKRMVSDSFTVSVEIGLDGDLTSAVGIEASHKWVYVNCCKFTNKPYNWCNTSKQDNRC